MITGNNQIGHQQSAKSDKTYRTFDPQLNHENDYEFYEASSEEINEAVQLASEAFRTFRTISGEKKAAFLNAIADEILELGDELIETYCSESGLPEGRAQGERARTIAQLKSFADLLKEGSWVEATIDTAQQDRQPLPKSDLRKMMIPLGPVVVFGASNFPLAFSTAGGDTASALAAGCPVIVKSHPMHSGTGELVANAIIKAAKNTDMPNGVFSNLNSAGTEVGSQLVKHPGVKAVGFTGSIKGGRALYDLAAQREEPIPVFAEMGSVNPIIILPKALENRHTEWAKTYANSVTIGTGQFCTNPGIFIGLDSDHLVNFIRKLSNEILKIEPACMLHPKINGSYEQSKQKAFEQPNLSVVGSYVDDVKYNYAKQTITTVDGNSFLENPILHQEVFGPYSLVVRCKDVAEMEQIILRLEGQLTGTVVSDNDEASKYPEVIAALQNRVGRVIFNGVPTGVEVCPSMSHGGPYPASTDSRFTAVGIHSIKRWVRPITFQDWPNELLPDALKDENPLGISRLVDNNQTTRKL